MITPDNTVAGEMLSKVTAGGTVPTDEATAGSKVPTDEAHCRFAVLGHVYSYVDIYLYKSNGKKNEVVFVISEKSTRQSINTMQPIPRSVCCTGCTVHCGITAAIKNYI